MMKISHSNYSGKTYHPSKFNDSKKKKKPIAEFKKVEEILPKKKKEDNGKHISWAKNLIEVKVFSKGFTKKRSDEIREKAKKTSPIVGKSILAKRITDYPEESFDTAPSTPRENRKRSTNPSFGKNIKRKKVRGSRSLVSKRTMLSTFPARYDSLLEARMHMRYGFISRIIVI